jgi:hypothetical protein
MRPLTQREKRTLRLGGIGIGIYLAIFGGLQSFKFFDQKRGEYKRLQSEAQGLKREIQLYQDKATAVKKLMDGFQLDPGRLSRTTTVAEASAAIQKTAMGSGVAIGSIRESAPRASSKELATIQMEASGPVPALTGLLRRLETVGYPLIVETMQINSDPMRPGMIKMNLTIVILDFDQWKKGEVPNA